ncbi:unnamed protein product [Enterobius vermicularis]|uniref:Kinesin-like protein n=1 Tax=Enterobius vermicularis TaxID=51028 RepID=A0A0N4V6W8_ENTVE|nr:unnamed protein product [Enterobius vermicularis]
MVKLKNLANDTNQSLNEQMNYSKKVFETLLKNIVMQFNARYQKEVETRRRLHNRLIELLGNIRVFCRIRPLNINEKNQRKLIRSDPVDSGIVIAQTSSGEKKFTCDKVFGECSTQSDLFDEVGPIITSCMDGYNVCIFAYGHTGSGKTYTMEGPDCDPGINLRSLKQLFKCTAERDECDWKISISALEIYNEKIRDLLSKSKESLCIRVQSSGALDIPGLTSIEVHDVAGVNKVTAMTELNDHSSRSHAIVRVTVYSVNRTTKATRQGRLNLVDLAGSERVYQSGATGQQLKEAQSINKSLSELGNVVNALRQRYQHIPFRNCQLTRLLEDCLNGDSKTLMIVQIAPGSANLQDSLSSLNFAEKVGRIQTSAVATTMHGHTVLPSKTVKATDAEHLECHSTMIYHNDEKLGV